jgi:hypothetical protein
MKKLFLGFTLMSVSILCTAADWQRTAESGSGDTYFMDFSSVASVGKHKKAWVQMNSAAPKETSGYPKKKYQSARLLYMFDCQSKMLGTIQSVRYEEKLADGQVVENQSVKFHPQRDLTDVVPDTVGEALLNTACATPKERARLKAKNEAELVEFYKRMKEEVAQEIAAARRAASSEKETTDAL